MSFYVRFEGTELLGKMLDAETLHPTESGEFKKNYVLREIRSELGNEHYNRYLPVLSEIIDLLKSIANDNNVIFTMLLSRKKKRWWSCV
jgi:hypothetical protein